ncbi:hypothetical protein L226DRAFT_401392 [Lentinus tigrinus ALCF2SS1-7]|uniref:Uncharacterized protein n=1 Tax=Lentinus tigrinus ALCF2SS1-6 TaxID=1328759 RepID=A0A5C2RMW7_9APHY|nr:hypothetical protein L227DRAFT_617933 [Lentinus tigrinus ALCF2SS1-6]RPD52863.1 hypothetical protein L227DRAFT_427931 [Lentinus tigrinus ALCF2SS1-6]RPD67785.1 hypothetical protein L226DRAFT_401392 [Lentinus tigrinus ALCF2SS1-7]
MPTQEIDDNDPSVQYFSGWSQDNSPGSSHNTLHGPSTAGATASLSFSGTGIEVHGVVRPSQQKQSQSLQFLIDKGSPTNFASHPVGQQTNAQLYRSPALQPGTHTLEIVNQLFSGDPVVWLDFFVVSSSQDPDGPQQSTTVPPQNFPGPITTTTHDSEPVPTHDTSSADSSSASVSTSAADVSGTQSTQTSSSISHSSPASEASISRASGTSTGPPSQGSTSPGSNAGDPSTTYSTLADHYPSTTRSPFTSSSTPSGPNPVTPATTAMAHGANHPNVGAIVGGVIAALVVLLLLVFVYWRRHRKPRRHGSAIFYPFTMAKDEERVVDDKFEVGTIATTAEGVVTTWNPERLQVPSRSPNTHVQPPRRKPVPVDIPPDDVSVSSPTTAVASRPVSSKPLMHQSASAASVDTADVSRASWHAL